MPVVVAAVTGATITTAIIVKTALVVGGSLYLRHQQKKQEEALARQMAASQITGVLSNSREAADVASIIYGVDIRVGGSYAFMHSNGGSNSYLYCMMIIAPHEFSMPTNEVWVNGEQIQSWQESADYPGYYTESQALPGYKYVNAVNWNIDSLDADPTDNWNSVLGAILPDEWDNTHKLNGLSVLSLLYVYNANVFPGGIPTVTVRGSGKKLYSPTTTLTEHSNNVALAIRDFLTNDVYGFGEDESNIDDVNFAIQEAICNQIVPSTGDKLYTVHGSFLTDRTKADILQELLSLCAGSLLYLNGKWQLYVGYWQEPTTTITIDDLVGSVELQATRSRSDIFNSVKGVFTDPTTDQPADYPSVQASSFVTIDGEEIWQNIDYPSCNNPHQCQRLAYIELEKNRQEIVCKISVGLRVLDSIVSNTVKFTFEPYGWSEKYFEIVKIEQKTNNDGGLYLDLTLEETDSSIYDYVLTQDYDPAPNTTFPSIQDVVAPSNLQASEELRLVGDVIKNIITFTWDVPDSPFTQDYEIYYKELATGDEIDLGSRVFNSIEFTLEKTGLFELYVRTRRDNGVTSDYSYITKNFLGKTAPPSDVTNFNYSHTVEGTILTWDRCPDLDYREFELRSDASALENWVDVTFLTRRKTTDFNVGFLSAPGYSYYIKSIDTTNNFAANANVLEVSVTAPTIPSHLLKATTVNGLVILSWQTDGSESYDIAYYEIRKGSLYADSVLLATINANYINIQEVNAGDYTYWVVAYDKAGNSSTPISLSVSVDSPPDFEVALDYTDDFTGGTKVNFTETDYGESPLLNTTETYQEHFDNNSFTSPQDQIDAGFDRYLMPLVIPSSYEYTHDVGAVLKQSRVSLTITNNVITSEPTQDVTMSVSEDGITWRDYVGVLQVYESNFRYVKVLIEYSDSVGDSWIVPETLRILVDAQIVTDQGRADCLASDTTGTEIPFNLSFADIVSINVTSNSTGFANAVVSFNYSLTNPTSFKVLIFNELGNRIDGSISWQARGY